MKKTNSTVPKHESGVGCQSSSSKASGGSSTSTSAILCSTLCVQALPLSFTTTHCRSHLNPALNRRRRNPSDQSKPAS